MKTLWNKNWKSSKQPRKQRKYVFNAPLHILKKLMSARLTKELKTKYGKKNVGVRKDDKVKIMSGQFKGKSGKVIEVDLKHRKVYVDGINIIKKDGNKVRVALHPSKLMIMELNMEDKMRKKLMDRK
ncbi:50S ribosomal protein L24 [Candidatus Woesearchaeota archaeon]|nr:large subunit ribosomal protein L24 [uncultured archaeon]KHO54243.1 MAG: large subunit ribosomal protein L24 [archaeon GW2011_AR18]MBS3161186.1 50S ribosomal protein L24 [Candidatus Woesearchaeota archaeon]HIH25987.1 50S ribosomal protein L24 [Nanoarchaeota archaeon]